MTDVKLRQMVSALFPKSMISSDWFVSLQLKHLSVSDIKLALNNKII